MAESYYLTVTCPDRAGLIASITTAVAASGGNILDLRQHTAVDIGTFFLTALFEVPEAVGLSSGAYPASFAERFSGLATEASLEWELCPKSQRRRVAILVSKTSHCLYELLIKHRDGELDCDIPLVIGNHPDLADVAARFGVPFETLDFAAGKEAAEARLETLLADHRIDLVVLARYMQILSPALVGRWRERVINIHHGFLPAFKGAKPYHQAWYKGVKLIGATAHYVSEDLDQGPIISQDVLRVSDNASIAEFIRLGKDVERKVLLDALRRHLSHTVFVREGRTFTLG